MGRFSAKVPLALVSPVAHTECLQWVECGRSMKQPGRSCVEQIDLGDDALPRRCAI